MDQNQLTIIIVVAAAIIAVVAISYFQARKKRSEQLRERFGPEYDRVLKKEGDVGRAEGVLQMRAKRREQFEIRSLSPERRSDFSNRWSAVQALFVDDPAGSVSRADQLVMELMASRGYPIAEFDRRADDLSVDHPVVVENYRAAHSIAIRHQHGQASTEDLRKAMVHYRSLFDELLQDSLPERKEARG